MEITQLQNGMKYVFALKAEESLVVGILPIIEVATFKETLTRASGEYLRLQREDNSTYLLRSSDILKIESE